MEVKVKFINKNVGPTYPFKYGEVYTATSESTHYWVINWCYWSKSNFEVVSSAKQGPEETISITFCKRCGCHYSSGKCPEHGGSK